MTTVMKKYKVLKTIAYSGVQEIGSVIEMDEETARAFGGDYVAPISESVTTDETAKADQVEEKEAVQPKVTRKAK
jgi:hypothetical protein